MLQFGGVNSFIENIMNIRGGEMTSDGSPLLRYSSYIVSTINIILVFRHYKSGGKVLNRKLQFVTLLTVVVLMLLGGRATIIFHFFMILFMVSLYSNLTKKSVLLLFLTVFLFSFFYRSALFILQEDVVTGANNLGNNFFDFMNRFFLKNYNYEQSLLVIGDFQNNLPLLYLGPIKDTILTFWPESLIPIGKYENPRFTYLITQLLTLRNVEDTMTPGLLGLFYLMGREVGVFLGMLILGSLVKLSINIVNYIKVNDKVAVLYILSYVVCFLFFNTGSIESSFKSYVLKCVPLIPVWYFMFYKIKLR